MKKIHLSNGQTPLCNIQQRWASCDITSTRSYATVTCGRCRKMTERLRAPCVTKKGNAKLRKITFSFDERSLESIDRMTEQGRYPHKRIAFYPGSNFPPMLS